MKLNLWLDAWQKAKSQRSFLCTTWSCTCMGMIWQMQVDFTAEQERIGCISMQTKHWMWWTITQHADTYFSALEVTMRTQVCMQALCC